MSDGSTDQPALVGLSVPEQPPQERAEPSAVRHPVAEVVVDSHLAHLDRPFEYAVPADLHEAARPGVRVRVRFAGRLVDGFLLARKATAEHSGRLAPLLKVVSDEVVLTPAIAALCREIADYYGGTMADVVRLAVPPRHARAEKSVPPTPGPETRLDSPGGSGPDHPGSADLDGAGATGSPGHQRLTGWEVYPAGAALLRRLAAGDGPRAAWTAVPDAGAQAGWPQALAAAVEAVHRTGKGSILVLPDHRDLDRLAAALDGVLGPDSFVRLSADLGPEGRYRAWLRVLRGHTRVVIGSRSAAFAPVHDLGLVAWWDDGDDNLQEPRAPYPHVREVLRRRSDHTGAGLLVGGYSRTAEIQRWVQVGELPEVRPGAATLVAHMPRIIVAGEGHHGAHDAAADSARLPSVAWRAVRDGLRSGPVLVQVPRRGYVASLSCEHCRTSLRCATCAGPVQLAARGHEATCGWCGRGDQGHPCRECGGTRRRSRVVGEERTAEEIGRAFPGFRVVASRGGNVLATVTDEPTIVVATPGAEPVAEGGYAATLLLDGWAVLDRGGLDAGVEALRRWMAAAALTQARGPVVLAGVPPHAGLRPVEALVRWDPVWLARRELQERAELGLPPVRRTALLSGEHEAVMRAAEVLRATAGQDGFEVLGPLATTGSHTDAGRARIVVRAAGPAVPGDERLPRVLHAVRAGRSLRKEGGELEVRLDARDLDL